MLIPYGLIPGSYSPFINDKLDTALLRERLEAVTKGATGLHGPANHSEMCMLTFDEWKAWIDTMVSVAREHNINAWAFLGAESLAKTVPYIEYALEAGCNGIILHPPYKVEYSQEAAYLYYKEICERYPEVPFVIYPNFSCPDPQSPYLVARIAQLPNIVGVKMTRRFNIEQAGEIYSLTRKNPHFNITTGSLINMYALRGLGLTSSFSAQSNYIHEWALELWNALQDKDWERSDEWYDKIAKLHRAFNHPGGYLHKYAGEKAAMQMLGKNVGSLRKPQLGPTEVQMEVIRKALIESGLLEE